MGTLRTKLVLDLGACQIFLKQLGSESASVWNISNHHAMFPPSKPKLTCSIRQAMTTLPALSDLHAPCFIALVESSCRIKSKRTRHIRRKHRRFATHCDARLVGADRVNNSMHEVAEI